MDFTRRDFINKSILLLLPSSEFSIFFNCGFVSGWRGGKWQGPGELQRSIVLIELHAITPRRLVFRHLEIVGREAKRFEDAISQLGSLCAKIG